MEDFSFTADDLTEGRLLVRDAVVGGFALEDSAGNLVLAAQRRVSDGVEADLAGAVVSGTWKVRFFHGEAGRNTSGGLTAAEAVMYALTFG